MIRQETFDPRGYLNAQRAEIWSTRYRVPIKFSAVLQIGTLTRLGHLKVAGAEGSLERVAAAVEFLNTGIRNSKKQKAHIVARTIILEEPRPPRGADRTDNDGASQWTGLGAAAEEQSPGGEKNKKKNKKKRQSSGAVGRKKS